MPEKLSIYQRVVNVVTAQLGIEGQVITKDTRFVDDLGTDSLDVTELVMEFEEEFDVNIPDDVSEKFKTVGQVVEYLESQEKVAD